MQTHNENLSQALSNFLEYGNPNRLSRNLRRSLLHYLQTDLAKDSTYVDHLPEDMEELFLFLDAAEEHLQRVKSEGPNLKTFKAIVDMTAAASKS